MYIYMSIYMHVRATVSISSKMTGLLSSDVDDRLAEAFLELPVKRITRTYSWPCRWSAFNRPLRRECHSESASVYRSPSMGRVALSLHIVPCVFELPGCQGPCNPSFHVVSRAKSSSILPPSICTPPYLPLAQTRCQLQQQWIDQLLPIAERVARKRLLPLNPLHWVLLQLLSPSK